MRDQSVLPLFDICSVPDCSRTVEQKRDQLCGPHYKRLWKYGDPTAGGPIRPGRLAGKPVHDHPDGTRTCNECALAKPIDAFHRDAAGTNGRRSKCGECESRLSREWYQRNRERQATRQRQRRVDNPELERQRDAARYERDKPKRIELAVEASHRRRARIRGAEHEAGITVSYLRKRDGDQCRYCKATLVFGNFPKGERPEQLATLEHRLPISRGGGHTDANCALACWRCNISKGALTEDEWRAKVGA